jgi:hypothetical protein
MVCNSSSYTRKLWECVNSRNSGCHIGVVITKYMFS